MKHARWIDNRVENTPQHTREATLHAGKKGQGRQIGRSISYQPESPRSCKEAERNIATQEEDAIAQGYAICPGYDITHEGIWETCRYCDEPALVATCVDCGHQGTIINCGHQAQPQPIAAGARRPLDMLCDKCAELDEIEA